MKSYSSSHCDDELNRSAIAGGIGGLIGGSVVLVVGLLLLPREPHPVSPPATPQPNPEKVSPIVLPVKPVAPAERKSWRWDITVEIRKPTPSTGEQP